MHTSTFVYGLSRNPSSEARGKGSGTTACLKVHRKFWDTVWKPFGTAYPEADTEAVDFEGVYANPHTDEKCRQFIRDIPSEVFFRSMSASAKRLLYLVVKCAWQVDDAVIAKAAFSIGVPTIWLQGIVEKARLSTEAVRIFKTKLDEKINLVWGGHAASRSKT